MDEQAQARSLIQLLSAIELEALKGLVAGESIEDLAGRCVISVVEAGDVRDSMKWKLGVTRDAEAVRIGLIAELESSA
jgi:hypothetical protein